MNRLSTVLLVLCLLLAVVATLGWLRPCPARVEVLPPDTREADSLRAVANARGTLIDHLQAELDSARLASPHTDTLIIHALGSLRSASVDSLRAVLLQRPE